MQYYLRFVTVNKWFNFKEKHKFTNIAEDEAPAINVNGLGPLQKNQLSVFESSGTDEELFRIGAAFSLGNDRVEKCGVVLIPQDKIKKNNFQKNKTESKTPLQDVNERHTDIESLSVDDTFEIINLMYGCRYVPLEATLLLGEIKDLIDSNEIKIEVVRKNIKKSLDKLALRT